MYLEYLTVVYVMLLTAVVTIASTEYDMQQCSLNHPNNTRFIWGRFPDFTYSDNEFKKPEVDLRMFPDWEKCEDDPPHPLTIIEDTPLPKECDNRAIRSLPPGLIVKESGIPEIGLGVWAEKFFPEGIRFGPYAGETYAYNKEDSDRSGYSWLVFCGDERIFYTDGENERRSNWLRFINTPMKQADENIKSYQHKGHRYYYTVKPIQPGTELFVYYGDEYSKYLGIDMFAFYSFDGVDWSTCDENSQDDYPTHPLSIIKDTPVPDECEDRAKRSLPPGLVVKESGIPGAGLGVWAEKYFPGGVRFGPYEGETFDYEKPAADISGYSWVIFCGQTNIYYTDADNERVSSWLRYVNMARNEAEENLKSYQQNGHIYYWTFKPIQPGTELLEFYGDEFAEILGIDMEKYYSKS